MIDLRSDTVTRPTPAMRQAMLDAEVGDDVFGDDPTVPKLEALAAQMLGKPAALFVTSGTQSNLVALLTHGGRGDEYIVGQKAHTYIFEGGGAAALGGLQPQPMDIEPDGTLDLDTVGSLVKPVDPHFARTRILCLENTTWGRVLPDGYAAQARALADRHGLVMHLDGARLFNAAVASGKTAAELAAPFDSVSVCLSKSLGAPFGSVLVGSEDFVARAKRWRKMVGGGLRQAGLLAAAGIHALENHIDRHAEDHANARALAEGLHAIDPTLTEPSKVQTNMVFARFPQDKIEHLAARLAAQDILIAPGDPDTRLVTHLDVSADDIATVLDSVRALLG